jgi:hypothetical protein
MAARETHAGDDRAIAVIAEIAGVSMHESASPPVEGRPSTEAT